MSEGFSLIDIGKLSEPATALINKISGAIGALYEPRQIRRVAKAEADAALLKAQNEIKITDLHRRAMVRFIEEEAQKQENIENIVEKTLPQLKEKSRPQDIDDDWITNFFDKCKIISDEEMQTLWSKVLAGEANTPGAYSKRTVNLLHSFDKSDATIFSNLCNFNWFVGEHVPIVFDLSQSFYTDLSIDFDSLTHLDDIGLISFGHVGGFVKIVYQKIFPAVYCGKIIYLELKEEKENRIATGSVLLTKSGQQLSNICEQKYNKNFEESVIEKWIKKGILIHSEYPLNQR